MEIGRRDRATLRLANEELRINIQKEVRANKALTEERIKEKVNNDAHLKQMEQSWTTIK